MNLGGSAERMPEALLRAVNHWEKRREATRGQDLARRAFSIAICREVGALGDSVARELGAHLGWQVYDHELLELIAKQMHVRVNLLESVDEKHVNWLQERVEAFAAAPHVTENQYARQLIETILSLSAHGECIIVGRGAAQLLPPTTTLCVRLVSPLEDRVSLIAKQLGLSERDATRHVKQTEAERMRFIKVHFQQDPTEPQQYDLTINSSRFSVRECAELIYEALQRRQVHAASMRQALSAG